MKISGLILSLAIACTPLPKNRSLFNEYASAKDASFVDKLNNDSRAMGACLAEQVQLHGWVGHGPKNEINALYQGYAETCYDKIKPTVLDEKHLDNDRALQTFSAANWFGCDIDDYMKTERNDEPETCTDPTTQIYVNGLITRRLNWKLQ